MRKQPIEDQSLLLRPWVLQGEPELLRKKWRSRIKRFNDAREASLIKYLSNILEMPLLLL